MSAILIVHGRPELFSDYTPTELVNLVKNARQKGALLELRGDDGTVYVDPWAVSLIKPGEKPEPRVLGRRLSLVEDVEPAEGSYGGSE